MARPREFDAEQVLRNAMLAFWQRGYEATSIRDLVGETKLARGSLYGAFGDKHQLFLAALEKYDQETFADMRQRLNGPGAAREILADWLAEVGHHCSGDDGLRGCLMAKAVMELAPRHEDVAQWARGAVKRKIELLAEVIGRGQAEGGVRPSLDPRRAARLIMNTLAGLRLMGATGPSGAEVGEVIELLLTILD